MTSRVVALTRDLIRIDTSGADEDDALAVLAPLLEESGLAVTMVPWRPGRSNLVATWNGGGPLTLSGHLDTVPIGDVGWDHGPLKGDTDGDRLHGRGSSDMKGGVAAIVLAAIAAARRRARGFTIALTSGEETGCGGAAMLRRAELLHPRPVLVIGEATGNDVRLGHKGATWLELAAAGEAAHGSRPELGTNAIEVLADAILALRAMHPGTPHPDLGARTTNVGTVRGGTQTNLVPDTARMSVDVRPVPGAEASAVRELLSVYGDVTSTLDLPAIWSDADSALTGGILDAVRSVTGRRSEPAGVTYFTDAAVLDATRSSTYVIGPGHPDQPHTTGEWVSVSALEQSVAVYSAILAAHDAGTV
ncbi:putative succinyl-diaminopimelate desuccinylase [Clavibacter michiganensis]|uniref:Putative succinyl-diaminopimelate desuccinylase n=1 Tax=Clavibacter michiganensis TaxID=28447 RepID=A0A251YE28_9MICO|nr:M20/M25/M40 family metallo-hydrolase [Clavibacter michiganensis]OUE22507.1 putative succinyl-diaminopimelate desuccinylase [Clavibacter michiganensis]